MEIIALIIHMAVMAEGQHVRVIFCTDPSMQIYMCYWKIKIIMLLFLERRCTFINHSLIFPLSSTLVLINVH